MNKYDWGALTICFIVAFAFFWFIGGLVYIDLGLTEKLKRSIIIFGIPLFVSSILSATIWSVKE